MIFKTPAPKDIVRWYRKGVPGGGQKDRIFDRLKAKLTGGTDDSGTSYFSMLEEKLSEKDADIIIKNMKTDIDGYPMLETGSTSGQDERTYQEWIVERYLKTSGTEGFTDTSVAEEEADEEAEEIVEEAEEEVRENIDEAVEVVDEVIEKADISDITDVLPQSLIDAVNQQQGTDYQKTKKSSSVSNTKILSTLVGSLQKIQGQLGSIDNELKKQNALIGAALGTTVSNLNQIETSHDGLNDRFDGILEAFEAQTALKKKELDVSIVFFDCDNLNLINRFKENRRSHPLKLDLPMDDIIDRERLWLEPLKKVNDIYIDTSGFSVNLLKKQLSGFFNKDSKTKQSIRIISFGYKYGLPREADIVFDMRFIKNPFYIKELSKLNGENKKVIDFINKQKNFNFFFGTIQKFFDKILIGFKEEGKNYITIAFGCTGGVHRSVVSALQLYSILKKNNKFEMYLDHRDIKK